MNVMLYLLKAFYAGKDQNDPDVQLRAPLDIFVLLAELQRIEHSSFDCPDCGYKVQGREFIGE